MTKNGLKKNFGIVTIVDALGASSFSDKQIRYFLASRDEIITRFQEKSDLGAGGILKLKTPNIFTFGDTVIITIQLNSMKNISTHLRIISYILSYFLFNSFLKGIMFRGAFSIGNYIEDVQSNTVMGQAVTDAAAWYEKSEWMGISCTPGTKNMMSYYLGQNSFKYDGRFPVYEIPLKDNKTIELCTIPWVEFLFEGKYLKESRQDSGEKWFFNILKDFFVVYGSELKYENTKRYFLDYQKKRTLK
jgi:hypothetical protein